MKPTFSTRLRKGFTLIELIVVIAILATLAAIAYPSYMGYMDSARASSASKKCMDIVAGITEFSRDHNENLPFDMNQIEPDEETEMYHLTTLSGKDGGLITILTNNEADDAEPLVNEKRRTYIDASIVEEKVDGVFEEGPGEFSLYDPWGQPYHIVMSLDSDRGAIDPYTGKKQRGKTTLVYCLGPDTMGAPTDDDPEATEDNIYSWKKSK